MYNKNKGNDSNVNGRDEANFEESVGGERGRETMMSQ